MSHAPLRIAVLSHIRHPIKQPFMGGMEAHSWHLTEALVRLGHDVTLFAAGDSETSARLRPVLHRHYDADWPWHVWHGTDALNQVLDDAFAAILPDLRSGGFDVIHNNTLHRYPPRLARRDGLPMVTSLHVPAFDALRRAVSASVAPWCPVTVCSDTHGTSYWPDGRPSHVHVVPNGIDSDSFRPAPSTARQLVWSGRITPTKGAHIAARAAQIVGMPLTIYGAVEHEDHFRRDVQPLLGETIRYGGHVAQPDLARRLSRAACFVFTPCWDEPFGLVAAEAMACGVPVAALPNGATSEVVGSSGAIARDETPEALADAIRLALRRDRGEVRADAVARFGRDRMLADYLALYRRAMDARPDGLPQDPGFASIELPPHPARRHIPAQAGLEEVQS